VNVAEERRAAKRRSWRTIARADRRARTVARAVHGLGRRDDHRVLHMGVRRAADDVRVALAAARILHEAGDNAAGITLLAAGTDGRDSATDAAGAVVDSTTWARSPQVTAIRRKRSQATSRMERAAGALIARLRRA
jgi:glycerate-2-kinase